eukprot:scaffold114088_cov33-Phaeocystis_antarctica.AAC.1
MGAVEDVYGAPGVMTRHSSSRVKPRASLRMYYALYLLEMRASYWLSFSPSHVHSHSHLQANRLRMPREDLQQDGPVIFCWGGRGGRGA